MGNQMPKPRTKEEMYNKILDTEFYFIVEHGWWYPWRAIKFFNTEEECLKYLNMSKFEFLYQKRYYPKHNEGFWYYDIEKIKMKDLIKKEGV